MYELPSALASIDQIMQAIGAQPPMIFLDFDGTLTPIVADPDQAWLSDTMRRSLQRLAAQCTLAVISGRGLQDVKARVGLQNIAYAGSHGFEISAPGMAPMQKAMEFLPLLDRLDAELRLRTAPIAGVLIERKRFSIAVHYRNTPAADVPSVRKRVTQLLQEFPQFRQIAGKKIFDLQPNIDWNKGYAVTWLIQALAPAHPAHHSHSTPLYIGDDVTDEDAFRALGDHGITISIQARPQPTAAHYRLNDPSEVQQFLDLLSDSLE